MVTEDEFEEVLGYARLYLSVRYPESAGDLLLLDKRLRGVNSGKLVYVRMANVASYHRDPLGSCEV
jgi:hypothetical protein